MHVRFVIFAFLVFVILGSVGFSISYARDDTFLDDASGFCDVAFSSAVVGCPEDDEEGVDVADLQVSLDSQKTVNVVVSNGYPGWEGYVDFTVENTGDKPVFLSGVEVEYEDVLSENSLDLDLGLPDGGFPKLFAVGSSWSSSLTVRVTEYAEQNSEYVFSVKLVFTE